VAIEKHIKEPLPKLRTDLNKVNLILFLLLDNAAQFTDEGHIEIHVEVIEGTLRCQITDTGIGICSDDRELVFDEFFQVDEAASTRYRGAGLGLTLVRELLALLEGDIAVESEIGRGTSVTFTVPVRVI
jgi:signal transduction histidine kinase